MTDPRAAIDFATVCGLPVVQSVRPLDTAGYKGLAAKRLLETGELLPGVETTPEHETHRVTLGKTE